METLFEIGFEEVRCYIETLKLSLCIYKLYVFQKDDENEGLRLPAKIQVEAIKKIRNELDLIQNSHDKPGVETVSSNKKLIQDRN